MPYINFTPTASNAFQNALGQGIQFGQMAAEGANQRGFNNALANYDPSNPESAKEVTRYNPQVGIQLQGQAQKQQQEAQLADVTARAVEGDAEARSQLLRISYDRWSQIGKDQQDAIAQEEEELGGAALYALNLGNPQAIRQAVIEYGRQKQSQEIMQVAQLPDEELAAALRMQVFQAGLVKDLISNQRPDFMAVPVDSDFVNTRDPNAVQQFANRRGQGAQQPIATQVDGVTYYVNPATGKVYDNPQEAMGGAGSNASGSFPGN